MEYEFFSTSRHPAEILSIFPIIEKIVERLDYRKANLSLSHLDPHVVAAIRKSKCISLRRKNPNFMRMNKVTGNHQPVVVENDVTFLNVWHRCGRGMFGGFSLDSAGKLCNYHLDFLCLDKVANLEELLPSSPKGFLKKEHKFLIDSYYPSVIFTPKAANVLGDEFQWSHLFSSCSRGFFAVPNTLKTSATAAKKYRIEDLHPARLGEFAERFDIVVAHGSETSMLDHASKQMVWVVGEQLPYWGSSRHSHCNKIAGSTGHLEFVKELKKRVSNE